MEALTIYPNSIVQLEKVKDILNELGIPFKSETDKLLEELLQSVNRGLTQSERNDFVTLESFKKKFSF